MEYRCRLIQVEGALNVRDIGGYVGDGGRAVAYGKFIRAASLSNLSQKGCDALKSLGVDCIVDLRSRREVQIAPDVLEKDPDVRYIHVPMLDYVNSNISMNNIDMFPDSMIPVYTGLLDNDQAGFKRVFDVFSQARGAAVFHCTAGKDRTGVTAMLLLGLAGVDREVIVEDYSYSRSLLQEQVLAEENRGLPAYIFDSKPETMVAALKHLDERYGGVAGYLEAIGIHKAQREKLKERLLA